MNILHYILGNIFKKKKNSDEFQIKNSEDPDITNLNTTSNKFIISLKIQNKKFEIFLN